MSEHEIYHHGVKGQRWGVRRFQNKDGSLTPLGEKRAAKLNSRKLAEDLKDRRQKRKLEAQKTKQDMKEESLDREAARKNDSKKAAAEAKATISKAKNIQDDDLYDLPAETEADRTKRAEQGKKLLVGAISVVGVVAASVAISRFIKNKQDADNAKKAAEDALKAADAADKAKKALADAKADRKKVKATSKKFKAVAKYKKRLEADEDALENYTNMLKKKEARKILKSKRRFGLQGLDKALAEAFAKMD